MTSRPTCSAVLLLPKRLAGLDKERADVQLVSLSCLSNEGRAIIDTPIKGFVTDEYAIFMDCCDIMVSETELFKL